MGDRLLFRLPDRLRRDFLLLLLFRLELLDRGDVAAAALRCLRVLPVSTFAMARQHLRTSLPHLTQACLTSVHMVEQNPVVLKLSRREIQYAEMYNPIPARTAHTEAMRK